MLRGLAISLGIVFVCASCATTASSLTEVQLGSTKAEVREVLGAPESLALAFVDDRGRTVEVLNYRLYQYRGAIEGLSPYYNIYSLLFLDDVLVAIQETGENTRLSEDAALEILDRMAPSTES